MLVRPVHAPPTIALSVTPTLTLTCHDNIGHAVVREVRTHLAYASPGVGEDDYPCAASASKRVVAPNSLELCEHFCITVAGTVWSEFERETWGETVQSRRDETGHCWMVSIKVGCKSRWDGCGGEYEVERIVEGDVCLGPVVIVTADGRDGLAPRSGYVT
jgi:hypothetical protein